MEEGWEEVRLLSKGWKAGEELAEWWGDREQAYATKIQRARVAAEEELYEGEGQMNEAIRAADKLLHEISRLKNCTRKERCWGLAPWRGRSGEVGGEFDCGIPRGSGGVPSLPQSPP